MPNKLSHLWQELKRRNVTRVLAVYIAAAFMILELVDMTSQPFGLPDWSIKVAFFILMAGLIIAVIVSWIYDIPPEGGMVKTEPAHQVKEGELQRSSGSWKIASYISFFVIVGLIVLNLVPRRSSSEILDKSIAVLPFRNDSPDEEKMYFINGTMEAILDNLCKIEELRVISRISVEQYRDVEKAIPLIAKEMNVGYLLEGSGQKIGNRVLLTVQLIDGINDQHVWSKQYDREIEKVEELIDIQGEIAQIVAREIEVVITLKEKELIEAIPTSSLTAYDFYQRARQEHMSYLVGYQTRTVIPYVEDLYSKALEADSTFAEAYVGLALVYWDKHYWDTYFSEEFLDSVLILADVAHSFNDQLADVYVIRGDYYREKGQSGRALLEYDKSIDLNPNNWHVYFNRAQLYFYADHVEMIKNLHKAISLNRSNELPMLLAWLSQAYAFSGFFETAEYYAQEFLHLAQDSAMYLFMRSNIQQNMGEWGQALKYSELAYSVSDDTLYLPFLTVLGMCYSVDNQYDRAYKYYKLASETLKASGNINLDGLHRIGYAFLQNGYIEEGNMYLDKQMEYCNNSNNVGRPYSKNLYSYYDLAGIYATRKDKIRAYQNLRIYNQKQKINAWMVECIKVDPLFLNLRGDTEFNEIIGDLEVKHQAEHERIRQWLEENDML